MYRARIMLIGQDRAGKTSLKKSFLGLPFDPNEQSTEGIEVDPSKFEVDVDQVKNWQRTDEKLSISQFANDLARMVAEKLKEEEQEEEKEETQTDSGIQDEPNEVRFQENVQSGWCPVKNKRIRKLLNCITLFYHLLLKLELNKHILARLF